MGGFLEELENRKEVLLQCCKLRFQFWQSRVAIEQIQPAAVNLTDILCPRPVKLARILNEILRWYA